MILNHDQKGILHVLHAQLYKFLNRKDKDGIMKIKRNIADSVQTEYCPTIPLSVRASVTGVTSHISHIYKGINAMLIIRGPIRPYIF